MPAAPLRQQEAAYVSRIGGLLFGIAAAIWLAPPQWQALGSGETPAVDELPFLLLAMFCLARGLVLQIPGQALAWWLQRRGWLRLGGLVAVAWAGGAGIYVLLDLSVLRLFGRHATEYLDYLVEPDAIRWAGDLELATWLQSQAGWLLVLLLLVPLAFGLARIATRHGRGRALLRSSLAAWVLVPVGVGVGLLALPDSPAKPRLFDTLQTLGLAWPAPANAHAGLIEDKLSEIYRDRFEAVRTVPTGPRLAGGPVPSELPDIVLIVLESFRADALDPEVTPELWRLSQRGVRFESHYAGSNASHGGLFSLLYSRPALAYQEMIESGRRPELMELLAQAGYRSHFVSGADLRWRGMERFLDEPAFDEVIVHEQHGNWQRDVASLETLRGLLGTRSDQPRLLACFFMSTHFAFDFPPDHQPFAPIIPPPPAIDPTLEDREEELRNRYRNSAHFIDSLIGELAAELDWSRTLLVVTGDHGESIFDDGTLAHASRLSLIQTHVPLVLVGAGVPAGRVIREMTDHAHWLDTLLPRIGLRAVGRAGEDLLENAAGTGYVSLVGVNPEADFNALVLQSGEHRYLLRLEKQQPKLIFHGLLAADGTLAGVAPDSRDEERVLRWFDDFLKRWWPDPTT